MTATTSTESGTRGAGVISPPISTRRYRLFDRVSRAFVLVAAAISVVFLMAPIVVIALVSFNRSPSLSVPPRTWSLDSYAGISDALYASFVTSVQLAAVATVVSVVLALPVSFWLARTSGASVRLLDNLFRSPLQVPQIVAGVSLYQIFVFYQQLTGVSLRATFLGLVLAHIVLVTPYVISTCVSSIQGRGMDLEFAAASLGAGPLRVFWQVSLPAIRQAVVASSILAALVSFDNVPLSLFLAGSGVTPLPVMLFSLSEQNLTPILYAAATLAVVFSVILTALLEKYVGLRKALQK